MTNIAAFVKYHREKQKLTQDQLSKMTGLGIHFIRDLEQGRSKLRLDKVNVLLSFFGFHLGPLPSFNGNDPWQIWNTFINKAVTIIKTDKQKINGFLIREIKDEKSNIIAWKVLPNPSALEWKASNDDTLLIEVKQNEIAEINFQTL